MDVDLDRFEEFCERVVPLLDERQRRLVMGALADAFGRGGTAAVASASGMSRATVAAGMREVRAGAVVTGRVRRRGAGRPRLMEQEPELLRVLDEMVGPADRGSALRWTTASTRELAAALGSRDLAASPSVVAQALRSLGFALRMPPGPLPSGGRTALDERFAALSALVGERLARGEAVVSAVTSRGIALDRDPERLRETMPTGGVERVALRDFVDPDPEAPMPYGVFDIGTASRWADAGADAAVSVREAVETWWHRVGADRFGRGVPLTVVVDGAARQAAEWEAVRRDLGESLTAPVHLAWLPPGTSRWRRVEHRLFHLVTVNRRAAPLESVRTTLEVPQVTK